MQRVTTWIGRPVAMSDSQIPVIKLDENPGVEDIIAACDDTGCFNVQCDESSSEVTHPLLQSMETFFSLPDDHAAKLAVHRNQNEGAHGWTPMLEEPAYEPGTIAWVESFDCVLSRERLKNAPQNIRETIPPMRWPEIEGFRGAVRAQWDALTLIAEWLFPLVSTMLKQDPGFLERRASSQVLNTMRLLNYPARPSATDDGTTGISAHTDFECITLIQQTAPGLEICSPRGEWKQVQVAPGQWTVLLGEVVEHWSNGRFTATPHRVPVTNWPRKSIVMFMAADPGVEIRPLDAFVDAQHPPAYKPVTQAGLIDPAMEKAEANRLAMKMQAERLREGISRD